MLSRFHLIPERYGRTNGRTDGQICYINIAHQHTALLTRDKNHSKVTHIKQQKYFHQLKRPGYNTKFVLGQYPRPFR